MNRLFDLEEYSGWKTHLLAYPYTNYNATTLSIIKEENIAAAFTKQEEAITIESDCYRLGRFQVLNQNGTEFAKQLRAWLQSS